MKRYYLFQFNGDEESAEALRSMFRDGWLYEETRVSEGYTWFLLYKLSIKK